ncbi:DNA polymerase [Stenotrophomonas phage Pokken]|uniref:DNA polymerase I n=1 Tax=Stenotrophomonas phage Pokken TaxID=2596674 RepID=A0A5B9N6U3_9CAUD|nr:DNA polymerase [Stenotrophomonas phage Pokken]QEG09279.1 DNA polymerase I [Stenotrophomonas phage Pokken]
MRYLTFKKDAPSYKICILTPDIDGEKIEREYITPYALDKDEVLVVTSHHDVAKKKTPAAEMKEYIDTMLVDVLKDQQVEYLLVTDSEYFKLLAKVPKAEANLGYVMDSPYGPWKVVYVPSYRAVFYDPVKVRHKISIAMSALSEHMHGDYIPPGQEVIKFEHYPESLEDIKFALEKLLEMDCDLTADIEAFDLKHDKSGIGTISFAWNQHEGLAFMVDYEEIIGATSAPYGRNVRNEPVRKLLREFFIEFHKRGHKMTWHNIAFDAYVLVYQLFMKDLIDTEGLLYGLKVMLTHWHDTKLITYLATNSCAGNKLGLKEQALEFAGNYAVEEIKDITKLPKQKLLRYNLVDSLSTWFVFNKWYQKMVNDQQLEIYEGLFQGSIVDIIQMQLTGLPINMATVHKVKALMEVDEAEALHRIRSTKVVQNYTYVLRQSVAEKKNAKYKKKRVTASEMTDEFNPKSSIQLTQLLFDMLELPVLAYTDTKQPSADGDSIEKLKNHTTDPDVIEFLDAMLDFSAVNKILSSFIPALLNASEGPDGWHYLFGNFNLGGTVSGRLSSSNPNLQNLPASSKYAKYIKMCVEAPPGWMFCGLDYASLEDRISALTTKDPQKLKVYTDGYDGHSMRAYAYWSHKMPDIDGNSVESVNSIAKKYKALRNLSKAPTFALTYAGTFKTLMKNCGFSEEEAKAIEANFKKLYHVSIKWVSDKLDQASRDGYVTAAFGLRVRTPLLAQVIRGNRATPKEAEAEGRTAGNALGQSWCLLNSHAWMNFMKKVRDSQYRLDIRPCAQIHDAGYALIREDLGAVAYANKHLVEAVQWQDHPDIWHDQVKLGGNLGIFYPNWTTEIEIANGANEEEILSTVNKALEAA